MTVLVRLRDAVPGCARARPLISDQTSRIRGDRPCEPLQCDPDKPLSLLFLASPTPQRVRGGYSEAILRKGERVSRCRTHSRFSLHKVALNQAHKILSVRPRTVTVVAVGPRVREWGFWTDKGFVQWETYLQTSEAAENIAPEA